MRKEIYTGKKRLTSYKKIQNVLFKKARDKKIIIS